MRHRSEIRSRERCVAFSSTGSRAQRRTHQAGSLEQQRGEVDLAPRAAHQADQHQSAAGSERGEVLREVARADRVEHHVDATAAGRLAHGGSELSLAVVDRDVRPELSAARALLLASGRDDDPQAGFLAERDRRRCRRRCRRRAPAPSRRSGGAPIEKMLRNAVRNTSGSAPASSSLRTSGTCIAEPAWTTASSA